MHVVDLVLEAQVAQRSLQVVAHDFAQDSCVGLPLLFSFLLMMFEKEVVRLEHGELCDHALDVGAASVQETLGEEVDLAVLNLPPRRLVLNQDGHD